MLTTQTLTDLRPFDFIRCPVCAGDKFTAIEPYGGVWCDECCASFVCRQTGGDAGCVVDCHIDRLDVPFMLAMKEKGYVMEGEWPIATCPRVYFYAVLKHCDLDPADLAAGVRWIITAVSLGEKTLRNPGSRDMLWTYVAPGVISKEDRAKYTREPLILPINS